jgi:succinoglycan biosynthesis protein ExoA
LSDSSTTLDNPTHAGVNLRPASVTVVVPVRNEEAHIAKTLDQLVNQELEGVQVEIIVADGQSTDRTAEIVLGYSKRYPHVRLLSNPQRLSSAARNLAIANSEGEFIVVVDGHCEIPNRRYFLDLVHAFRESGADCLGRPQPLKVSGATPLQRAIAIARSSPLGHHPESFIYSDKPQYVPAKSVAVAYRRTVFEKVGLFDESFDAHEDGEFNFRCDQAGLTCYLDPKLTVKYYPRATLLGLFKQLVRYGRGRVRLARKHKGNWGLGSLVPAGFVSYLILGAVLSLSLPLSGYYALGLLVYAVLILVTTMTTLIGSGDAHLLYRLPLVLVTIHVGAGTGTLLELLGL